MTSINVSSSRAIGRSRPPRRRCPNLPRSHARTRRSRPSSSPSSASAIAARSSKPGWPAQRGQLGARADALDRVVTRSTGRQLGQPEHPQQLRFAPSLAVGLGQAAAVVDRLDRDPPGGPHADTPPRTAPAATAAASWAPPMRHISRPARISSRPGSRVALRDPRPADVDAPLRDPLREAFDRRLGHARLGELARERDLAAQPVDDRRAEPHPALAERVREALEVRDPLGDGRQRRVRAPEREQRDRRLHAGDRERVLAEHERVMAMLRRVVELGDAVEVLERTPPGARRTSGCCPARPRPPAPGPGRRSRRRARGWRGPSPRRRRTAR